MKTKLALIIFFLLFFLSTSPTLAANNRFGIHIIDENDLPDAASLVNSSGGDWGYVTLVIREDERDARRWQKIFNDMRRKHLIPIVRLATKDNGRGWEKFETSDVDMWVNFLNSLNWVIKARYVIIGNEVNHATEWGGEVNPEEYGQILFQFSTRLKSASPDFFVLPAGLDASAPNSKGYMSEDKFLSMMIKANPNIGSLIDGWTSHSYPNPNFSGPADAWGRGTVRTYKWELEYLKSLGVNKNLPVFITETGWKHEKLTPEEVAGRMKQAFGTTWNDPQVVAVTPFILNYPNPPFDQFSFKDKDGNFYPLYESLKSLPKITGAPEQINKGDIVYAVIPKISLTGNTIEGILFIKNTGQSIWTPDNFSVADTKLHKNLEPGETILLTIRLSLPITSGSYSNHFNLKLFDQNISSDYFYEVLLIEPPKPSFFAWLWAKVKKL